MKRTLTLILCMYSAFSLFCQPANDDCSGLIDLGNAPICPNPTIYSNAGATESNIGNDNFPTCFNGLPERDVWFSFTAVASIQNYTITVSAAGADPILMPQMAVYRGDCEFDGLVLLDCATSAIGSNEVSIDLDGLTPGIPYFLRINDWTVTGSPNEGEFVLCVEENLQLSFTINEGGANACEGQLSDTGGPSGNYGNNESHFFTICPTEPHECIVFTLDNYLFQNGGDVLSFYDGPNTNSPLITTISGGANGATQGGVCYPVVATSGCLGVQFTSDQSENFDGFTGTWQCTDDCPQPGALQVQVNPSFAALEASLENPLMDISITNVICPQEAIGVFSGGDETNLGLGQGVLLTTGRAADAANPASFFASTNWGLPGNPDLDFISLNAGGFQNTVDACIVEMDVFVKTDRLAFDYVFGSDEYKQQFTQFSNDLAAVLVSGPGIAGIPGLNNQENIAVLPNGQNTVVQIQSLNATQNWQFYRNNQQSTNIAYNGLSAGFMGQPKTLSAQRQVTPCETYHVKLAIGDTDENDDSGLFIAPSNAGLPALSLQYNTGIDYLVEGCVAIPGNIQLTLPEAPSTTTVFNVEVGGTAILGTDYLTTLSSTVTFQPGQTQHTFLIGGIPDLLTEGTETIEIKIFRDYGCGEVEVASLIIEIKDQLEVEILPDVDTLFICSGVNTVQLQADGAPAFAWSPANIFDNPAIANPTATINANTLVTVTGTLGSCTSTDQVFLQLISPQLSIIANGSTALCEGDSILLTAQNNVNNEGLVWSPTSGLSNPTSHVTFAKPFATTTYTANVTASGGCSASDTITIEVEPFDYPEWVIGDTLICQNSSVQLAADVPNTSTSFEWTPAMFLDDANIPDAIATPVQSTTYTLTATSVNGLCSNSESLIVTVLPADVAIVPDTLEICLGDSVQISAVTSTGGIGLVWSPNDSLTQLNAETVVVHPTISNWYKATLTVGICTVADSVYVRVDSLPGLSIEAIPAKEFYCQGEVISLISSNFNLNAFPDIIYQWDPLTGVTSEDTLLNLVLSANTTAIYVRTTNNGGCSSLDSIEIVVVPVANITVMPANPTICPGETVQLTATADQAVESWEWTPTVGLSCTDCPNPISSPPASITYQVTAEFMGCPSFATVLVEVLGAPVYQFPNPAIVCEGQGIVLNEVDDPAAVYEWTLPDGTVFSTAAQPEVFPASTTTYGLTIRNGNCDAIEDEVTVTVANDFTLTVSADTTVCPGTVILTAAASEPNVVFVWTDETGVQVGTGPNLEVIVTDETIFTVSGTLSGGGMVCFSHSETVQVDVHPDFTLTVSPDQTIQAGEEVELMADASLSGVTFEWTQDGVPGVVSTADMFELVLCNDAIFRVTARDAAGCYVKMDSVVIQVEAGFAIDSIRVVQQDSTEEIYEGEELEINILTDPFVVQGLTYEWYFDTALVATTTDTVSGTVNAPEIIDPNVECIEVRVRVVAIGEGNCELTKDTTIEVCNLPVELPNAFSPNNDGENEYFKPYSPIPVNIVEFKIWDRWGHQVYDNERGNDGWDGRKDEKEVLSDVYVYLLKWEVVGGGAVQYVEKGEVTLLR